MLIRRHVISLSFLCIAPLIFTYPLVLHLPTHKQGIGDNIITMWVTAWQVHALQTPGETFWDANILHPYRNTLALSVSPVVFLPLAAPILWLTDNPNLMENLILLISMILSGVSLYLFCYSQTKNRFSSVLAGLVFSCCPERVFRLIQPHLINPIFFGVVLWFGSRFLNGKRLVDLYGLALSMVLQFLTSVYLFVFTGCALLVFFANDFPRIRENWRIWIRHSLFALVLMLALVAPFAYPYIQNRVAYEYDDISEGIVDLSARPADFLIAPDYSLLYAWTCGAFFVPRETPGYDIPEFLFPGFCAIGVFFYACVQLFRKGIRKSDPTLRFGVFLTLTGFILALGPWLHIGTKATFVPLPGLLLYKIIPGFSVIRAPARFAVLVSAGLGITLAAAVPNLCDQFRRGHKVLLVVLLCLVTLEYLNKPLPIKPIPLKDQIPAVERWLSTRPERVVIHYPLRYHYGYMYFSMWHWKRLINGWSSYMPKEFFDNFARLNTLPSPEAVETLTRFGAELIIIHRSLTTDPPMMELEPIEIGGTNYYISEMEKQPDLFEKIYNDGASVVFRFLRGKNGLT